jgi:Zinc-binding dehydrogenase
VYQPVSGFILEEYETFYEFTKYVDKDLTSMFIQFAEEYFTDYTADRSYCKIMFGKNSGKPKLKVCCIIVSMLEQPNSELINQYGVKAVFLFSQVNRQRLTKLAEWIDQNNIRVNVDKTFSLDEAGKALDYQKDVHPRGKVVLTV